MECTTKDERLKSELSCDSISDSFCLRDEHCGDCGTCLANVCSKRTNIKTNLIIIGGNHYEFTFDKLDLNTMKTAHIYGQVFFTLD